MKNAFILFFFIFNLSTLNLWAQHEESAFPSDFPENTVLENMPICFSNPGWDGILYMYLDGQPLYTGYWGDGYMLLKDECHVDFTSQIGIYPGGRLTIRVGVYGVGSTNTLEMTVPETVEGLRLYIYGGNISMNQVNAHF